VCLGRSHCLLVFLLSTGREDIAAYIQVPGLIVFRIYAADGLNQIDLGSGKNGSYGEVDLAVQVIEDECALRQAELGIGGLAARPSSQSLQHQIIGQIAYASPGEDLPAEAVGHAPAAGDGRPQHMEEIVSLLYGSLQCRISSLHVHAFREPVFHQLYAPIVELHLNIAVLHSDHGGWIGTDEGEPGLLPGLFHRLQEIGTATAPQGQKQGERGIHTHLIAHIHKHRRYSGEGHALTACKKELILAGSFLPSVSMPLDTSTA